MSHPFAIAATCEAIIELLRASYVPEDFGGEALEFKVYAAEDFQQPMTSGVSLFLYEVAHSPSFRQIPEGVGPDSHTERRRLPVELFMLLTAWAPTASRQHEIIGWMMRTLSDAPVLTAPLLNGYRADVFDDSESVELSAVKLDIDEYRRLWETLEPRTFRLSVAYRARTLLLTSPRKPTGGVLSDAGVLKSRRVTDALPAER